MRQFDVIVIGAGPAGCSAAYDLAEAGVRVLLLDRTAFPRTKPCAGMLTVKAINLLRYSIAPVIRHVARNLDVSLDGRQRRTLQSTSPIAVMTVRREFDEFCLAQTRAKGASFEIANGIAGIAEDPDGVILTTDVEPLRCRYLIGADGANSRVRRLLGHEHTDHAFALEGEVAGTASAVTQFDFRRIDGGYGWVFAKGDHLNVGLYTQKTGVVLSKNDLRTYARDVIGWDRVENIIGFPVGIGGQNFRTLRQRIFLVGDAVGATERLLGEGIHNAIKTGQAAAAAILAGGSVGRRYRTLIGDVQRDLQACETAAGWFYSMPPDRFGRLATHRRWMSLMRGFAAGKTFRTIMRTFPLSRFYRIQPVRSIVEYEAANGFPTVGSTKTRDGDGVYALLR